MQSHVPWHFPRAEFANSILDLFASGSTHAITLFAPRNMGKTVLLIEDLWPAAEKSGYDVRYASFWEDKLHPEAVFLNAITTEKTALDDVKARFGLFGSFVELTSHQDIALNHQHALTEIASQFKRLKKRRKKILLLLDEIQQLATQHSFDGFVALLRTLLDTNKKDVHVVFTGSSQDGLMAMFKRHKAPLFNFSHQMNLPELGSPFVKHMLAAFQQASGKQLNFSASLRVFNSMSRIPARFHDLLRIMLIAGRTDIAKAYQEYESTRGDASRYAVLWQKLKPLDQALLKAIAENAEIYSAQQRLLFAQNIGVDQISQSAVQKSLSRLKKESLIDSYSRGTYVFNEAGFKDFIVEKL